MWVKWPCVSGLAGGCAGFALEASPLKLRAKLLLVGYAGLAVSFAYLLVRYAVEPDAGLASDFTAFLTGWSLILHGRGAALYDVAAQRAEQAALMGLHHFKGGLLAFLQPPHAALAGVPLGFVAERLGEPASYRLWLAINVGLLVALARRFTRTVGAASGPARALAVCALLAALPIFKTLRDGQLSLLLALAAFGLYAALRDGRDATAGGWLLVLSIKPQLLPIPLALMAARGRWRALGFAAGFGALAALLAMAILGASTFVAYARNVHGLESHFGSGRPAGMPNLRGLLTLALGDRRPLVDALTAAAWLLGAVALAWRWSRRRERESWESAFATCMAATLVLSPHLFVHDMALWTAPLALAVAAAGPATPAGVRWSRFALAWPAIFVVALASDTAFTPLIALLGVATAVATLRLPQSASR